MPVNIGLLVVLFSCNNEEKSSIGNILEMSCRYRILDQPASLDPCDYLKHILEIVQCAQLANEVFYFGNISRGGMEKCCCIPNRVEGFYDP